MISMKTLIVEGRYDALVTKLSRELLQVVKDSYSAVSDPEGLFAGEKIYYTESESAPPIFGEEKDTKREQPHIYFKEIESEDLSLDFYLMLKVQWKQGFADFRKGGDAYNDTGRVGNFDPPLIEIRLEMDPADFPRILSNVAMELRDIIRHEIEHTTQSGWNLKSGKFIRSDQAMRAKIAAGELPEYRYFILPKEVDANLQGLYLQAKKSRRPFAEVVHEYLDGFVPHRISDKEKEKVLKIWRKRMPALGINREL